MRIYPPHYWTLRFLGGLLNGRQKRYPYCPVQFYSRGLEYRLVTKVAAKLEAVLMVKG